jgi:hypothetical protein
MHVVELRTGRWFQWNDGQDGLQTRVALEGETIESFTAANHIPGITELEGTGVRVTDENRMVVEPWVVRRTAKPALELATILLEKYAGR